jgi:hypothetical protein
MRHVGLVCPLVSFWFRSPDRTERKCGNAYGGVLAARYRAMPIIADDKRMTQEKFPTRIRGATTHAVQHVVGLHTKAAPCRNVLERAGTYRTQTNAALVALSFSQH